MLYRLFSVLFLICLSQLIFAQDMAATLKMALPNLLQKEAVSGIYATYAHQPLWITDGQLTPKGSEVWEVLQHADKYGLSPSKYQIARIRLALSQQKNNLADIYLTDGFAHLCRHLNSGVIDPSKTWSDVKSYNKNKDLETMIEEGFSYTSISAFLDFIQPQYISYNELLKTLQQYLLIAKEGGWKPLPANIAQLPKQQTAELLAARLEKSNDWYPNMLITDPESMLNDAISQYQRTHQLPISQLLDAATIASINKPVEHYIEKIRINLERYRWLPTQPSTYEYIMVNIPAYRAALFDGKDRLIQSNVIVGAPKSPTKLIVSKASRIVINPTWTVPYKMAINEILPQLNQNPKYLEAHDMDLFDANGNLVSLTNAQIKALTRETFRYDIRQRASDENSLGHFVLYFPNSHFIYMHDTNNPGLFERPKRALSHGCVRTQEIENICYHLIEKYSDTPLDSAKSAYENRQTTYIPMREHIPVYLQYFTVWTEDNTVYFLNDLYGLDEKLKQLIR